MFTVYPRLGAMTAGFASGSQGYGATSTNSNIISTEKASWYGEQMKKQREAEARNRARGQAIAKAKHEQAEAKKKNDMIKYALLAGAGGLVLAKVMK